MAKPFAASNKSASSINAWPNVWPGKHNNEVPFTLLSVSLFLPCCCLVCVAVCRLPASLFDSCISLQRLNPMTERTPIRPCDMIRYLSVPVLPSSPPAPRSHSGPRRTSRRSGSPDSSSSLHGGSGPVYGQPSSRRCPLRCIYGIVGLSDSSWNAAAPTADLSRFRRKPKVYRAVSFGCLEE